VVLERTFDPARVLELIPKHRITTMFGVPAMFLLVSKHPKFADTDLTTVRTFMCGGAPVPEALIRLYGARGISFAQVYGLTETAPFASMVPIDRVLEKVGSAGVPPFFTDVQCVDERSEPVPTGERGEVVVRGPNVMKGYWNRSEATAEAIRNGWFHTGDVGVMDEEGYLYIVDRKKDMIISGGENVSPAEVENAIYKHPDVEEVAVIGIPDARWGETVRAVVVAKDGTSPTEQDIIDFTQDKLARYKRPRSVLFTDVLPRNAAGKVLKPDLRENFDRVDVEDGQHQAAPGRARSGRRVRAQAADGAGPR
jgi:fatty-acyl-CoA synthase